jgi:hypothetical protein
MQTRFGTIFFHLKECEALLTSCQSALRSMLLETGSKEWTGPASSELHSAISGLGSAEKIVIQTLDGLIFGTPPAISSSSLPTKQEESERMIDQTVEENLRTYRVMRDTYAGT